MRSLLFFCIALTFAGCTANKNTKSVHENDWAERKSTLTDFSGLEKGTTYLSVYSSIYSYTEQNTTPLTATVSLRNTNKEGNIHILKSSFYNTAGELIREYIEYPIVIAPMETVEIVIYESDNEGGTGGNFIFDWAKDSSITNPYFDAVMLSKSGQQGLSFTTTGIETK